MTAQFSNMQVMIMLAFIADAGALETNDCEAEKRVSASIGEYLRTLAPVQNDWELVWGPCLYKFPVIAKFPDNTVYVVQNRQHPSEYVIAISGTNPYEITDWVFEDFLVGKTEPWAYGHPPSGARISQSAKLSLSILQKLKPCDGVKGENLHLIEFLKGTPGISSVTVTGHSLGGEMASTTALWLSDTQGDLWDTQKQARVSAYTFAAPTAGNAIWASYFHQQLGDHVHRIWNSLDVVPHAWQLSDLKQIRNLYEPQIKAPLTLKLALKILILIVKKKDYTQIPAIASDQQPLKGSVNTDPEWARFFDQIAYQHVDAYIKLLDVPAANVLIPFMRDTRPKAGKLSAAAQALKRFFRLNRLRSIIHILRGGGKV
jgi:triacylglycerol lipase